MKYIHVKFINACSIKLANESAVDDALVYVAPTTHHTVLFISTDLISGNHFPGSSYHGNLQSGKDNKLFQGLYLVK